MELKKNIDKNKINNLIKSLKLSKYLNKVQLTGLQKRAIISQADKNKELVLLEVYIIIQNFNFDEPTSALDKDTAKEIIKKIYSYKQKKTIIIISHDKKIFQKMR